MIKLIYILKTKYLLVTYIFLTNSALARSNVRQHVEEIVAIP